MQLIDFTNHILPLKDKLFRIVLCIVRNKEEAEDAVQELMLKIWHEGKDEVNNWEAYCTIMAKNWALDRVKRKNYHTLSLQNEYESVEQHTPLSRMQDQEQVNMVAKCIAQLPENKRIIIQLRDIEGKSYQEISLILNLTEGQVKIHLFRARQELKQLFNKTDLYE